MKERLLGWGALLLHALLGVTGRVPELDSEPDMFLAMRHRAIRRNHCAAEGYEVVS